jgi:hypothetical protein
MGKGVLRPIIPRKPLYNVKAFDREMMNGLKDLGKNIEKTFEGTVENWETKVDFKVETEQNGSSMTLTVYTTNEIYGYVNDGTRAHTIVPVRAPALRFASGFVSKTRPNSLRSGAGRSFGPMVTAKIVHHPGTTPRHFTKYIALKHTRDLFEHVQDAVNRAAKEG